MLFALGKTTPPIAFVMPERIATSDPFKQISEYVGSGPMRFLKSEWGPGAKAVFEADYVLRQEPASWLAGGKRMQVDRIEWIVVPDPATAAAALRLHPAHPGHGHSRPTGLGAVALAERICGEADRLDPTLR